MEKKVNKKPVAFFRSEKCSTILKKHYYFLYIKSSKNFLDRYWTSSSILINFPFANAP
jgi:hypothetical protein